MIYPGIMIGNGALNSQFNRSPKEQSGERSNVIERSKSRSRSNKAKVGSQLSTSQLRLSNVNKLPSTEAEEDVGNRV